MRERIRSLQVADFDRTLIKVIGTERRGAMRGQPASRRGHTLGSSHPNGSQHPLLVAAPVVFEAGG